MRAKTQHEKTQRIYTQKISRNARIVLMTRQNCQKRSTYALLLENCATNFEAIILKESIYIFLIFDIYRSIY